MKKIKTPIALTLVAAFLAAPLAAFAAEKTEKAKPYPLDKCIVTDEKLGADGHGEPYVFTDGGQEFKLCCKPCLKTFNKDKAKFVKKLKDAEAAKAKAK